MAVLKDLVLVCKADPFIKPKDFFDSYGGFKGFVAILEKLLDTEVVDTLDGSEVDELQKFIRSMSSGRFDKAIHKIANNLN